MPIPAYIIMSDGGSVDEITKRVSFFNILEAFTAVPVKLDGTPSTPVDTSANRIAAAWLRDADDSDTDEFESQIVGIGPDGGEIFHTPIYKFSFTTLFQRFDVLNVKIPGFNSLGIHIVEGRLRALGQVEWKLRQSFPFVVQQLETPSISPGPAAG